MFGNKTIESKLNCLWEAFNIRCKADNETDRMAINTKNMLNELLPHLDKIYQKQDALAEYLGIEFVQVPKQQSRIIAVKKQDKGSE